MLLDERLALDLKNIQAALNSQGRLPSRSRLQAYHDTFRKRFGPERLAALDGEALLQTMHSHGNQDSLVYWLEFKDDDEFPAIFGSIAGGSAHKFGLFRRRETGAWTAGSPRREREVSVEEAVQIARRHRDQLLRGCDLLAALPDHASEADYARLQQDMDSLAPDVGKLAWGHKYFFLLFPDKLDDYHSPVYQRFHLIKLLQMPPEGEGRYVIAHGFVAVARDLDMPMNHLTTVLNARNKEPHPYWRIGTSRGDTGESLWPQMRDGNHIAVGWLELSDLSWVTNDRPSRDRIKDAIAAHSRQIASAVGRSTQQIFDFVVTIQEGDVVVAADGARNLGIGRVTGGYVYDPNAGFPHQRPVEWLNLDEWRFPHTDGLRTSVYSLRKHAVNLVDIERRILGAAPLPPRPPAEPAARGTRRVVPRLAGVPGRIQSVLERKGQVILYGPPGTGKTFWAVHTARELAAYYRFGTGFASLTGPQRETLLGASGADEGLVRTCVFHPAYGYEDFLEGYRPVSTAGQLAFEQRAGIFKRICDDAGRLPDQRFYLVIDEINRGDIPRIFGELLTALEKDRRGESVLLPLSGAPFQVPANVQVIGTMNTADRSIALLDAALRRRFGFVELMPDSAVLGDAAVGEVPLGPWLDSLNQRIREHIGRDARNLQIGHSYLLEDGKPVTDAARFAQILRDDILPLLEEYCYEDFGTLLKILGPGLVDERGQRIKHELFEPDQLGELLRALLAPDPDIVTSARAVAAAATVEDVEPGVEEDDQEGDEADLAEPE